MPEAPTVAIGDRVTCPVFGTPNGAVVVSIEEENDPPTLVVSTRVGKRSGVAMPPPAQLTIEEAHPAVAQPPGA